MSLNITEPIKTVNLLLTKALAAESQLLYLIQREDYPLASISDVGGFARLQLPTSEGDKTTEFQVGNQIYVHDNNGVTSGLYQVTAVVFTGLLQTALDTSTVYSTGGIGYLNNLSTRGNYRILISIEDTVNGEQLFRDNFVYIPNQAGFTSVDLGGIVTDYMKGVLDTLSLLYQPSFSEVWDGQILITKQYNFNSMLNDGGQVALSMAGNTDITSELPVGAYIHVTFKEGDPYAAFNGWYTILASIFNVSTQITIGVVWSTPATFGTIEPYEVFTELQAVLAEKQILSLGGANMWENLLQEGLVFVVTNILDQGNAVLVVNGGDLTQVLTTGGQLQFNSDSEPTMPSGVYDIVKSTYNPNGFDSTDVELDYIFTGAIAGTVSPIPAILGKLLTKFVNPVMWRGWNRSVSVLMDTEFTNRTGDVNGYTYRQNGYDINKNFLGGSIAELIGTTVGVNHHEITSQDFYYIGVKATQYNNAPDYSEELFYQVGIECENPIMLDWINSVGGIEQWLFNGSERVQVIYEEGVIAEKSITTDIENVVRTKRRYSRSYKERIILGANNLRLDQLNALEELKFTESLRVYLTKDGSKFVDAIVTSLFTSDYSTDLKLHKFRVEIEFPDNFRFYDAKQY